MSNIEDIKNIIAKINIVKDDKITQDELKQAEGKIPSVWLEKIGKLADGKDISIDKVMTGLGVEPNPNNKPVTEFHDKRPDFIEEYFFDNLDKVPTQEEYHANWTDKGRYDATLPMEPLNADLDFSNSEWFLHECSYGENTFANTPKEHLPEGYDPKTVFELGKNPGLNVRAVHNMGVTGNGVKVAIFDWQLPESENYDDNIVSYRAQELAKTIPETMHGAAVTSIIAGKETGVAPGADVYYFAEREAMREGSSNEDMIKSLKEVLEINKNLPADQKIRVISISGPIYGGKEADKLVKQLNKSGVWVLSSPEFWNNCGYLSKKDSMGNPDDFDNYKIHNPSDSGRGLYVNSGDRTVTNHTASGDFRHDSKASASWAIPVVAGYYALACEVDPSMTPKRFLKLAEQTAQVRELDLPPVDVQGNYERHEGFVDYFIEYMQKQEPNFSKKDIDKMKEKNFQRAYDKMFEEMKNAGEVQSWEDLNTLFAVRGKEILNARGEYDEEGNIKEIPKKYLPKETTTKAKIIDIKALIEKLQSKKS